MNLWERQYDLVQLKYLAVLKDLHEMEGMLSQPVVQQNTETRQRAERLIAAMRGKISTYRTELAFAKRMTKTR